MADPGISDPLGELVSGRAGDAGEVVHDAVLFHELKQSRNAPLLADLHARLPGAIPHLHDPNWNGV
jgi:hypothetical protein